MRGKKCWKRVTAVLMAFMMLVGLVMTNGITSEAYWYNSEGGVIRMLGIEPMYSQKAGREH